jgi:hypothetical protein
MPLLSCQPHEGGALGFEERMAGSRWSMVQNETAAGRGILKSIWRIAYSSEQSGALEPRAGPSAAH